MMGFCIMLYTVHTTQEQGQGQVPIVFYCTYPGPGPCPIPGPVQCEWAIMVTIQVGHHDNLQNMATKFPFHLKV